ncbi:MAG: hypothetical protein B7Z25_07390, partial [Aerococcus viridans]
MMVKKLGVLLVGSTILLSSCGLFDWGKGNGDIYGSSSSSATSQVVSESESSKSASSISSQSSVSESSKPSASNTSTASIVSSRQLQDYPLACQTLADQIAEAVHFPLAKGYHASFTGDSMEYSSFTRTYDFIDGNLLYMRSDNGGTTTLEVVKVTKDKAQILFGRPEAYAHEAIPQDLVTQMSEPSTIYLQAPLEKGHKWQTTDGSREIIGIDVAIKTPTGNYKTIEVIEKRNDGSTRTEYYAKDVGLVYAVDELTGESGYLVTQSLSKLAFKGWTESIPYQYVTGPDAFETATEKAWMTTNTSMALIFTEMFQGKYTVGEVLLPKRSSIQSITTNGQMSGQGKVITVDFTGDIASIATDDLGKEKLDAMISSIDQYYNADEVAVTVNGKPMVVK